MDKNIDTMLDMYLFETNTLLEQLDDILIKSEKDKNFSEENINEIFRIMHTIKGSSAMMQFDNLMSVAHKIEDLFFYIRDNGISEEHQSDLFDLMFKSSDFLKNEISHIENDEPLTIDIGYLEQEINNILKKISFGEIDSENQKAIFTEDELEAIDFDEYTSIDHPTPTIDLDQQQMNTVKIFLQDDYGMENLRALILVNNVKEICANISYLPADLENKKSSEEIAKNGFTINFYTQHELDSAIKIIENFIYTKDYSILAREEDAKTEEEIVITTADKDHLKSAATHGNVKQSLINVNLKKLDKLMDMVGEIVIAESMISANVLTEGSQNDAFEKTTRELRKLTNDLQEIVMSVRMVPVAEVFQKMNRIVRDMNKQLGKDVQLVLIGEDSELDKTIVDSIADPIMHLVRNSMDHGIETKAERLSSGKKEQGTITLSAKSEGGEIVIFIEDDGKGLNAASILKKAKENGLLQKPENEYTDNEIYSFIFIPGFSTNTVVTEYSGRGVGMDVVKNNIEKIGGLVTVESQPGKGTRFIIKIPLTLAIISGMQISVGKSEFTIPINNIKQAFKTDRSAITYDMNGREIVMLRKEYYPIVPLNAIFGIETEITNIEDGILILVEAGNKNYCLFADVLLGEQQIVVKQLPAYLHRFKLNDTGITGCAILGTGKISLILDPGKIQNAI